MFGLGEARGGGGDLRFDRGARSLDLGVAVDRRLHLRISPDRIQALDLGLQTDRVGAQALAQLPQLGKTTPLLLALMAALPELVVDEAHLAGACCPLVSRARRHEVGQGRP